MSEHFEDRASLYALGLLGDDERAAVESHLRGCTQCAAAVAEAEDDVALMVAAQPQHAAPPGLGARVERTLAPARTAARPTWIYAMAAAIVIAFLPAAWMWNQNRSMQAAIAMQTAAMNQVANAPHRTASFKAVPGNGSAMVAYAPNGEWYVIVVKDVSKALDVVWMHDGTHTMLGRAVPHGNVATLYLPKSHRMNSLALMDGNQIVAQAQLRYD